jgi:hypothetical protein
MNQKQLDFVFRVAELGGFRKASQALRIAQPVLAHRIIQRQTEQAVAVIDGREFQSPAIQQFGRRSVHRRRSGTRSRIGS